MSGDQCLFPGPYYSKKNEFNWVLGVAVDSRDETSHLLLADLKLDLHLSPELKVSLDDLAKKCDGKLSSVPHLELFDSKPYYVYDYGK